MSRARRRSIAVLIAAAAGAALPAGLLAQECGLAPGVGVLTTAGGASYDQLQDVSGGIYGIDAALPVGTVSVQAGYRRALLGAADADMVRVTVALPVPARLLPLPLGPLTVCGIGHAGAARLPVASDATLVMAGGAGLRLALRLPAGRARTVTWGEVRGLAGRSTGSLFGWDVRATGMAVGVEGGVRATFSRMTLSIAGAVDGFDDGLGITPYPNAAAELGLGIRF